MIIIIIIKIIIQYLTEKKKNNNNRGRLADRKGTRKGSPGEQSSRDSVIRGHVVISDLFGQNYQRVTVLARRPSDYHGLKPPSRVGPCAEKINSM